jgi:hypothetical protein
MRVQEMLAYLHARPLVWAVPVTVIIALAGTGDMIFREDVRRLYETNGDVIEIWKRADEASPVDLLRWWTGVWIERDSPYYRPLVSALLYFEYVFFGPNWRAFCIVMWLMHAGVCVLMLLLLARLWSGLSATLRMVPGIVAVAWFSIPCETTADGPHWGNRGIARGIMPYFPAQTDVGSLLLSLASLLLFDKWLESRRAKHLAWAAAAFVAAMMFKEHAVIVPLLAAGLALYRRLPLKWAALVTGCGIGVSGLFLLIRRLVAPEAWGPEFRGVGRVFFKFGWYLSEPGVETSVRGHGWVTVSALIVAVSVAVVLWRPRLASVSIFGVLFGVFGPPALMVGNMALPTIWPFAWWLLRVTLLFLAVIVAWEARWRAPTLPLLAGVAIAHLPILHVTGPHYYYWPVAWWSMFGATGVFAAVGTARLLTARRESAEAENAPEDGSASSEDR